LANVACVILYAIACYVHPKGQQELHQRNVH